MVSPFRQFRFVILSGLDERRKKITSSETTGFRNVKESVSKVSEGKLINDYPGGTTRRVSGGRYASAGSVYDLGSRSATVRFFFERTRLRLCD